MSRESLTTPSGVISQLEVSDIKIIQNDAPLAWDNRRRNSNIQLLNNGSTAISSSTVLGEKGVLSKTSLLIGTDSFGYTLNINKDTVVRAGLALATKDLSSSVDNGDLISKKYVAFSGDHIIFLLDTQKLTVEFGDEEIVFDITKFIGQTMYPWLSSVDGVSMSVTIQNYQVVNIKIDEDNIARINTTTEIESATAPLIIDAGGDGIGLGDFALTETNIVTQSGENFTATVGTSGQGVTVLDPDGDVKIDTKIQVDEITAKFGSSNISLSGSSGYSIVDSSGNFSADSGDVINAHIKAPIGASTKLVHDGGSGINVSSGGIVTFNTAPKLNNIQSQASNNLTLLDGTSSLGITVTDTTGLVEAPTVRTNVVDARTTSIHQYAPSTATKLDLASSGVDTEVKGNLNAVSGLGVTGNITVTGTVDGVDIAQNTVGSVSVHSDVNITSAATNDILQYDSGFWVNKNLATAGITATGHTHTASDITDFDSATDSRITLQRGAVNGIASLDPAGIIPTSELALGNLEYKGVWNASTNTPTLSSGSGTQGYYYVISVAGSTSLDGVSNWQINDWAVYNGTAWEKVDNTNVVTSVAGKQGVVTIQASDLTDVTDAGSGAIITTGERSTLSSTSTTYLALVGGTLSNTINMGSNNITNANDIAVGSVLTVGNNLTVTVLATLEDNMAAEAGIILGTGSNGVTLSAGTSAAARTYDVQDQGITGTAVVINNNGISLVDDTTADATPANSVIINGTDKTAGTGNGGALLLRGGTSSGGSQGYVQINSKTHFIPQTEPSGVAGDVYYDSSTNKLRVHNGTTWADLH